MRYEWILPGWWSGIALNRKYRNVNGRQFVSTGSHVDAYAAVYGRAGYRYDVEFLFH